MQAQRTYAGDGSHDLGEAVVMRFAVDADWLADREDAIEILLHGQQAYGLTPVQCRRLAESAAPRGWMV